LWLRKKVVLKQWSQPSLKFSDAFAIPMLALLGCLTSLCPISVGLKDSITEELKFSRYGYKE